MAPFHDRDGPDRDSIVQPHITVDPPALAANPSVRLLDGSKIRSNEESTVEEFFPSPEAMAREISEIMAIKLSAGLQPWAEGYARVGHRDPFIWNWARRGVEITMLSRSEERRVGKECRS